MSWIPVVLFGGFCSAVYLYWGKVHWVAKLVLFPYWVFGVVLVSVGRAVIAMGRAGVEAVDEYVARVERGDWEEVVRPRLAVVNELVVDLAVASLPFAAHERDAVRAILQPADDEVSVPFGGGLVDDSRQGVDEGCVVPALPAPPSVKAAGEASGVKPDAGAALGKFRIGDDLAGNN